MSIAKAFRQGAGGKQRARLTHLDPALRLPLFLRRRRPRKLHHLVDLDKAVAPLAHVLAHPRVVGLDALRELREGRERGRARREGEVGSRRADDGEPVRVEEEFRAWQRGSGSSRLLSRRRRLDITVDSTGGLGGNAGGSCRLGGRDAGGRRDRCRRDGRDVEDLRARA